MIHPELNKRYKKGEEAEREIDKKEEEKVMKTIGEILNPTRASV